MASRRTTTTVTEEEPEGLVIEGGLERAPDEGTTTPPPPPGQPDNGGRTFSAEDLEKARQQEKDKLYSKIEQQEGTLSEQAKILADLKADLDARRAREAEEEKRRQDEQAARDRDELSAKDLLDQRQQEWEARFAEQQAQIEADRALLAREAQYQELLALKDRLLREADADNTIAPQLLDYVGGHDENQIRQSIAMAQAKSADILTEIQTRQQQLRQGMKGASVTQPPVGPMETDQAYETITKESIENMSMDDWARNRGKILQAASRARFGAQQ